MRHKPLLYVAGAYRSDPEPNTNLAMAFGRYIRDTLSVPVIIPHLSHFQHLQNPADDQYWLDYTMEQMLACDAVFRMHNGPSAGSDAEEAAAVAAGIPVFHSMSELAAWIPYWKAQHAA